MPFIWISQSAQSNGLPEEFLRPKAEYKKALSNLRQDKAHVELEI